MNVKKERIIPIIEELDLEYREAGGDLFLFLLNYFFPKIDTKSDKTTDDKGRYSCQCEFMPTEKKTARDRLDLLAEYFNVEKGFSSFQLHLDIHSMVIPDDCVDEEFGSHTAFYGEDGDYFAPIRTSLALKDEAVLAKIEEDRASRFSLIIRIMTLVKRVSCKHERLGYAGSDYDSDGNKCKIQECQDCGEVFMVPSYHP